MLLAVVLSRTAEEQKATVGDEEMLPLNPDVKADWVDDKAGVG